MKKKEPGGAKDLGPAQCRFTRTAFPYTVQALGLLFFGWRCRVVPHLPTPTPRILFSKNIIKNVINWLFLWEACNCLQKTCHASCHLRLYWSRKLCSCLQLRINSTIYLVLVQVTYKILTELNVAANNTYSKWAGFITGCDVVAHILNIHGEWYIHTHMQTEWKYI